MTEIGIKFVSVCHRPSLLSEPPVSSVTKDVNSFSTPNKALPKQNEANTFWGHDQLRVHFVELTP